MFILSSQMYLIILNYVFFIMLYILKNYANYGNSWVCELCQITLSSHCLERENTDYMPEFLFIWYIIYINSAL